MSTQIFEQAKHSIIEYYKIVDINKTGGFTAHVRSNGTVLGSDPNYQMPKKACLLQIQIIKNNNALIQNGLNKEFRNWLRSYEREVKKRGVV